MTGDTCTICTITGAKAKVQLSPLIGVRMSNFSTSDSKQTKLKVVKAKGKNESESFFDMVEREKKNTNSIQPEPLGLLAYMTDYNPAVVEPHSEQTGSSRKRPPDSLDRFSVKQTNIWDDLSDAPTRKVRKPGNAGAVTICSLLDSDSTTDPFDELDKQYPPSSTPHVKSKVKGTLDYYCTAKNNNQEDNSRSSAPSSQPEIINKTNNKNYFAKTRSIWDEFHQSSDDDIVCVSDSRQGHKVKPKPAKSKRGRGRGRGTTSTRPIRDLFSSKPPTTRSSTRKKSRPLEDCEVITLDSD